MRWFCRKPKTEFVCATCGKTHAGPLTDYGYQLPDVVWAQPAEERQRHLDWSTDMCYFDGRWYLRGVLEVPITFKEGRFGWGVWAQVSEQTMAMNAAHNTIDTPESAPDFGEMANAIPPHPDTLGLPLQLCFGDVDKRPLFIVAPGCDHPLAVEQREGITEKRYHEILASIR